MVTRYIIPYPCQTKKKCTVARVVTSSSYGNALHYDLFMFVELEKFPYPSVIAILVRFFFNLLYL